MIKVSAKGKNWSDFRVLRSTQLQEEDWSKIKILSLNSLARYRICKKKKLHGWFQRVSGCWINPQWKFRNTLWIGKRFCKSSCVFFRDHVLKNWISGIHQSRSRFIHPQWKRVRGKIKTNIRDASLDSKPKNAVIFSVEDSLKNYGADQQRNLRLLEYKVQDRGMYLFTMSYGSDAMDQGSGVGWFSGWIKIFVIYSQYSNAWFWSTWCEDCFSAEQNHP